LPVAGQARAAPFLRARLRDGHSASACTFQYFDKANAIDRRAAAVKVRLQLGSDRRDRGGRLGAE
jgi:hypothetical protein